MRFLMLSHLNLMSFAVLVLDERIEEMGDVLKQHYDIVDFGDPNSITEVRHPCLLDYR